VGVVTNIKVILEYDGTDFYGFQKQPSRPTIQGELERALSQIFHGETVKVVGAGRTDAGVHAVGQVINFHAPRAFPVEQICPALNGNLPTSIRAKYAEVVPPDFHARYSAVARTYVYVILNRATPSAFLARYTWWLSGALDVEAMCLAGRLLVGIHDFASFGLPDKPGASTVRQIYNFRIARRKDTLFVVIRANAFLKGMARAIVGTLVRIGQGKLRPEDIRDILNARNRRAAGISAPPQGLFLTRVDY
jgi:tRNA pseudouridine38-40 synthase